MLGALADLELLAQQYVSIWYFPLEFATACAWGQFVKNVAFAPWFPGTLNNGTESPACGQKLGPKIELTRKPVWLRSP